MRNIEKWLRKNLRSEDLQFGVLITVCQSNPCDSGYCPLYGKCSAKNINECDILLTKWGFEEDDLECKK